MTSSVGLDAREVRGERFSPLRAVFVMAIHVLAAVALAFPSATGAVAFVLAHFVCGCLGVSLGYHRCLAHRAFKAKPAVLVTMTVLGALALQGGPLTWAALHRCHHLRADRHGDPHSAGRGFGWSHIGWIFYDHPNGFSLMAGWRLIPDLLRDRRLHLIQRAYWPLNIAAFLVSLALLGWEATLWVFPLRIVLSWHSAWLVNSLGHGGDRAAGHALPRNVRWLAWLTYGEGLHANHHNRPYAASFSRGPRDLDPGYGVIRVLAVTGAVVLRGGGKASPVARGVA